MKPAEPLWPLTQLIRIRQANRIAASETAGTRDELKKAENEVAVKVHELYFNILATRLQKRAADQETAYAQGICARAKKTFKEATR